MDFLDSLSRQLLEALLNCLWQGALVGALVWLTLRAIRKGVSATTRHAIWLVSLLTVAALPAIVLLASVFNTAPLIRTAKQTSAGDPARPSSLPAANPLPAAGSAQVRTGLNRTERITELRHREFSADRLPAEREASAPNRKQELSRFRPRPWTAHGEASFLSGRIPASLISIWLAVSLLLLGRILLSYLSLVRMRRSFGFVSSEESESVEKLAESFGIKRTVRVFTSRLVSVPMTIGSFRPIIVLPPDLRSKFTRAEFESVIAHELAHIKRWDYSTNLLQRLVQALFFYHPAVWLIGKQMAVERELACDDWAVKTCEPRRYAGCLTKLVELVRENKPFAAAAGIIFGKHVISRRVEMILNRDRNATTAVSKSALVYVMGLALIFAGLCCMISPVIAVPLAQDSPQLQLARTGQTAQPAPTATTADDPPSPHPLPKQTGQLGQLGQLGQTGQLGQLSLFPADQLPPVTNTVDLDESIEAVLPGAGPIPAPAVTVVPAMLKIRPDVITGIPVGIDNGQEPPAPAPIAPIAPITPIAPAEPPAPVEPQAPIAPFGPVKRAAPAAAAGPLAQPKSWSDPYWTGLKGPFSGPGDQDDKDRKPAISEGELLGVLTEIVKRDSDASVRNEALQGIYRLRSDAAINTLIDLYDGINDVKIKGEIIGYLLRREGDNSKATAKLVKIARSESSEELRARAIRYLGAVKGDEGANRLIEIYDGQQDAKVKQAIIRSLGANKSRKAIDKLIQIAKNDSDPTVRQYAIRALYGIDERLYLDLVDKARTKVSRIGPDFKYDFDFPVDIEIWNKSFLDNSQKMEEKAREMQDRAREMEERARKLMDEKQDRIKE